MTKQKSNYRGSEETYRRVASQIAERWGQDEVANYDPYQNCMGVKSWNCAGFKIKKGEKSLKSITIIEKLDSEGNVISKYPRTANLFYIKQVEPVSN